MMNDPQVIDSVLRNRGARWAVVGLTENRQRAAHNVALYVRDVLGMAIIPVNLRSEPVHGETAYRTLGAIDEPIDVVDIFVNSTKAGDIVDQAIRVGAKTVWLQVGVIDEQAAHRARDAGLNVIMDTCPAIEGRVRGIDWRQ